MFKPIFIALLVITIINSQNLFAEKQGKDTDTTQRNIVTNTHSTYDKNNDDLRLSKDDLSLMFKAFDAQSNRTANSLIYVTILVGVITILIGLFSFLGFIIQYKYGVEQKNQLKATIGEIKQQSDQSIKQALHTLEISKNITSSAKELIESANKDIKSIETKLNELNKLHIQLNEEQKRLKQFDDSVEKRLKEMKPSKQIEKEVKDFLIADIQGRYKYPEDLKKEWLDDIKAEIEKLKNELNDNPT